MHTQELSRDPYKQFNLWHELATASNEPDSNAFSLATASLDAIPSVRTLLFKGLLDHNGHPVFSFYSNSQSQKGQELASNPKAEMLFYWHSIYRQIRIAGDVVRLSREQGERYFYSRPFASNLSAIVSKQSRVIGSREELEAQIEALKNEYLGKDLPCPDHWQAYGLIPNRFEFWSGRVNRLHDRFRYEKDEKGHWITLRLAP
jgi:pyridoxamine 5'-phosphate oxidase